MFREMDPTYETIEDCSLTVKPKNVVCWFMMPEFPGHKFNKKAMKPQFFFQIAKQFKLF